MATASDRASVTTFSNPWALKLKWETLKSDPYIFVLWYNSADRGKQCKEIGEPIPNLAFIFQSEKLKKKKRRKLFFEEMSKATSCFGWGKKWKQCCNDSLVFLETSWGCIQRTSLRSPCRRAQSYYWKSKWGQQAWGPGRELGSGEKLACLSMQQGAARIDSPGSGVWMGD